LPGTGKSIPLGVLPDEMKSPGPGGYDPKGLVPEGYLDDDYVRRCSPLKRAGADLILALCLRGRRATEGDAV
jgi:hypothetical protein